MQSLSNAEFLRNIKFYGMIMMGTILDHLRLRHISALLRLRDGAPAVRQLLRLDELLKELGVQLLLRE